MKFALTSLLLAFAVHADDTYGSSQDPSSYSNVDHFRPVHLSFDMTVLFDSSAVDGVVTHSMQVLDNAKEDTVWMDVWDGLTVNKVEFLFDMDGVVPSATERNAGDETLCPLDMTELEFEVSTPNPNIGNALAIKLPCVMNMGDTFLLRMEYLTNENNYAMSWMTPSQTAGGEMPYMYSLCQMNFCRDFAPMMDSPSQKITYDAKVVAPSDFVVKMSANTTSMMELDDGTTEWMFECSIKMPSYLIAIVVGNLVEYKWDDRVSVVSEPEYLDAAIVEFEELPQFLAVAEDYLSPYVWGTYSIVIMPPSFPWGGMEHPLITFASHTLVTGDKSQVCW